MKNMNMMKSYKGLYLGTPFTIFFIMKLHTLDNLYNNEITSSAFSLNRAEGFFSHLFIFSLFLHVLGLGQQKAQYPLQEAITQPFSPIFSPHHYFQ